MARPSCGRIAICCRGVLEQHSRLNTAQGISRCATSSKILRSRYVCGRTSILTPKRYTHPFGGLGTSSRVHDFNELDINFRRHIGRSLWALHRHARVICYRRERESDQPCTLWSCSSPPCCPHRRYRRCLGGRGGCRAFAILRSSMVWKLGARRHLEHHLHCA
jgi:hypothetical protein